MLRRLRIENFVLIREADLAFASGLNVVTGETGAGKTILAQAVGLLLGAPGDAAYLGPDAKARSASRMRTKFSMRSRRSTASPQGKTSW